ncbi:MAG: flippase-like domain-containing protein [Chloroflexi bacterium]|nr:flippase-like domain-containing protein [Chloroflexota bacterium]
MKRWHFWLGLVISAAFLYKALSGLHLAEVAETISEAQYLWLIPGVLVYFGAVWARTWRWHYLLRPLKVVPLRRLFPVVCIGYMGNNVYPARAGEVIRAYVLKRKDDVSVSASLATVIVERIFDGVVMLLFVFASLPFTPMPDWLRQIVVVFSLLFFGSLAIFFAIAARPALAQRIYNWFIDRLVPERFREPARGILDRFMDGLASLRSGRDVLMVFVTSLVIWLTETVKYWFVMHGFGFTVPFYVLMLMNGVVNLATTIPSSPGYVGTFDTPGIEVLKAFGVPAEMAAGYTFVLHAALWLPITLLGAFYMWRESVSWRDFAEARRLREESAPADPGPAA